MKETLEPSSLTKALEVCSLQNPETQRHTHTQKDNRSRFSRIEFLSGLFAGTAALAACSSGGTIPLSRRFEIPSLAELMKKAGVVSIDYEGYRYLPDGSAKLISSLSTPSRSVAGCLQSPDSAGGRSPAFCDIGPSPTPTPTQYTFGDSFMNYGPDGGYADLSWGAGPYYGLPGKMGPIYKATPNNQNECSNPLQEVVDFANQIVEYIEAHGAVLGAALVNAAQNAVKGWQGSGLGAAAAAGAAAEFIGVVFAGMSFGDVLAMLAVLGIGLYSAYELLKCVKGALGG